MASPYSDTLSLMNRSAFLILRRSVHHLNRLLGAGNPLPSRQTQKLSSIFGLTRLVEMGRDPSPAADSIISRADVICWTIFGDSTRVSEDITNTRLCSFSGGMSARAFHINCTMQVESLPPLNPSIQGRLSDRYTSRISE